MTYDEVVKKLQTLLEIPLNQEDENFRRILPRIIEYAEQRIYRELDFLATTTELPVQLIANSREFDLDPSVIVLRQMAVMATVPKLQHPGGFTALRTQRYVLERVSPEALDMFWPEEALSPGIPKKYAIIGKETNTVPGEPLGTVPFPPEFLQILSHAIRLMPRPDKAYSALLLGVMRPKALSPNNTETYLSTRYPDLFCAACMVFASGYQRDFGAQADDPQKAMSWEGMYGALRQGVMMEATKQKQGAVLEAPAAGPAQARAG